MNIFFEEHRSILEMLIKHRVDFIIIGGYAVNYYGYNRSTGDMDIWIQPDNINKEFLLNALSDLGFDDEGIFTIRSWDFTQPQKFYIGEKNRPDRTDFMTHIAGVTYDPSKSDSNISSIDGLLLHFISYHKLIQNKKYSGRLKDLADVEYLEKIYQLKTTGK